MSTSFAYKALTGLFRVTKHRDKMIADARSGNQRNAVPKGKRAARWTRTEFDGRAIWTCEPKIAAEPKRAYVHEHGGGYIYGLMDVHYMSLMELADHAGVTVIVPDYPLPPQARAPEIIDWADRHFASVVDAWGIDAVALGGCSAGGNLALAILQRRAARDDANPERVALWSPWVDLTQAEAAPTKADDTEAVITPFGLEPAVAAYLGESGANRTSPDISPLFADLTVLPMMHIMTGAQDILFPAIDAFADALREAGKLGEYVVEPDYGHYWMFYPVPDRHPTLKRIAGWLL